MSSAPVRGIVPQRQRRHHHHHHNVKHHRRHHSHDSSKQASKRLLVEHSVQGSVNRISSKKKLDSEEKRPKVNPIFLWAAQREQRIIEVRCEDYDKRNRIKLTKTAQGWRSIPRTALTTYPIIGSITEDESEQRETLTTTSKNEEKENSLRKEMNIKQVGGDKLEDTRINGASRLHLMDKVQQDREKYKCNGTTYNDYFKNKKNDTDSETEKISNDTSLQNYCKIKKRRKVDQNKKSKRICSEEFVSNKSSFNTVKIKQESQKVADTTNEIMKSDNISAIESNSHRVCIKNTELIYTSDDDKKGSDLEQLHNNRHFQPRVVLEQLHLSQLPSRIHRRLTTKLEQGTNDTYTSGIVENHINEIVGRNVERNNNNNEIQIVSENKECLIKKSNLTEVLSMLDSNNYLVNQTKTTSTLTKKQELSRSDLKLTSSLKFIKKNKNNKLNSLSHYGKLKRKNQFAECYTSQQHVGNKSLDETIERLERSINYHKKFNNLSNILEINECDSEQKVSVDESKCKISNSNDSTGFKKNVVENSTIYNALKNTPGLSISLAINDKTNNALISAVSTRSKTIHSIKSPDSQAEVSEKIRKSIPRLSIAASNKQNQLKTSSILKDSIELPESTGNFYKNEQCLCELNYQDVDESDTCDSQTTYEVKSKNRFKRHTSTCIYKKFEDFNNYADDDTKNYTIDSTKSEFSKPYLLANDKNSEAQAKYSNLTKYHENFYFNKNKTEVLDSPVFPEPSDIPFSLSSTRKTVYLERLLPSPPCSVSCSEDAKIEIIHKDVDTLSNNSDLKSKVKKLTKLNVQIDSELHSSYNNSDEKFLDASSVCDKTLLKQRIPRFSKEKINYLEVENCDQTIISSDVYKSYNESYGSPKYFLSTNWIANQQRIYNREDCIEHDENHTSPKESIIMPCFEKAYPAMTIFMDPASQLRELIKTSGHLIPDPLLVPRDYLPMLAGAPLTEIPRLLAKRPELRLPEALTRPELLKDPDLLVISLTHLQQVLDHGDRIDSNSNHSIDPMPHLMIGSNEGFFEYVQDEKDDENRPKLSCKPIGKLMPAPIDLSSNNKSQLHTPLLRVRSGLLKQESEVSSTANSPDDSQLWHPLFGSSTQKQRQLQCEQKEQQQQHQQQLKQRQQQQTSWHRTTLAS